MTCLESAIEGLEPGNCGLVRNSLTTSQHGIRCSILRDDISLLAGLLLHPVECRREAGQTVTLPDSPTTTGNGTNVEASAAPPTSPSAEATGAGGSSEPGGTTSLGSGHSENNTLVAVVDAIVVATGAILSVMLL